MPIVLRIIDPAAPARSFKHGAAALLKAFVLLCVLTMANVPSPAAAARLASILVDASDGRVLQTEDADTPHYPASLTKMMTLYLAFEALDEGRVTLDQPLSVSARAAAQPPTKLGLRAGQSIPMETAMLGLVTKSANDAAAVLAENLAGSEDNFALRMTGKAQALGMTQTVFRNASGLPDPNQVTTARDMSVLAMALLHHYPHYYHYFSVKEFYYGGRPVTNHNRLLGVYDGVDGIKTGYTRAAGFNLVASALRGDRRLIGVVLGAPSSKVRNAMMTDLLDQAFRGESRIELASLSQYLGGGSVASAQAVGDAIATTRRQVAYAPPPSLAPRSATTSADRRRGSTATARRGTSCGGGSKARACQVAARPATKQASAKQVAARKASTKTVVAAQSIKPTKTAAGSKTALPKAKATAASPKPKPAVARGGKTMKASASRSTAVVPVRKASAEGTRVARR